MVDQQTFWAQMDVMDRNCAITSAFAEGFAERIVYECIELRLGLQSPPLITIDDEEIGELIGSYDPQQTAYRELTSKISKSKVNYNGSRAYTVCELLSHMLYGENKPAIEDTPFRIPKAVWDYYRFLFKLDSANSRAKYWKESPITWEEVEKKFS